MQENQKFLSTPNNGGLKIINGHLTITGHQEVSTTGKSSRSQSKTPRDPFLMTKFKKSQTKAKAHGS